METKGYNSFSIARAKELFLTDNIINIGDDFILAERTNEANYDLLRYPCRVDAYVAAFCKQGSFKCSINLKEYEIHEGMMLLNLPQNIIRLESKPSEKAATLTIIAVSTRFLDQFRSDISKMLNEAITILDNPCFTLQADELNLVQEHIRLINSIIHSDYAYATESVSQIMPMRQKALVTSFHRFSSPSVVSLTSGYKNKVRKSDPPRHVTKSSLNASWIWSRATTSRNVVWGFMPTNSASRPNTSQKS